MFKVIVAQPIKEAGVKMLEQQGYLVECLSNHDVESLCKAVENADGLLVRDAHVPRQVLESGSSLRVVARHGAGLDRIDLAAATEFGIQVTNAPLANSVAVTEHVMAMMLCHAKNLFHVDYENRKGNFDIRHKLYGFELSGKILGILGLGNIGRRVALIGSAGMNMEVLGYDPYLTEQNVPPGVRLVNDWKEIIKTADIMTIHLPLTKETNQIIGLSEFEMMKPNAFFINCARGPVVIENDLVEALQTGIIGGAGIDVYDPDPPRPDHPLFRLSNVIVTPHTAAHTEEAMTKMATHAAQGILRF